MVILHIEYIVHYIEIILISILIDINNIDSLISCEWSNIVKESCLYTSWCNDVDSFEFGTVSTRSVIWKSDGAALREACCKPTHSMIQRECFSLSGNFCIIGIAQRIDRIGITQKILIFFESHSCEIILFSNKSGTREIILGKKKIWMGYMIHELLDFLGSRFFRINIGMKESRLFSLILSYFSIGLFEFDSNLLERSVQ